MKKLFELNTALDRPALAKRLTFYKLRADVQISDDDRSVTAIWPSTAGTGFADPRQPALGNRVYGAALDANASEQDWHDHRIALGVPHSGLDFDLGEVFPHDVLMDQFSGGGVDFTKGCYVGQEVVSRMQHRGTARNRFVRVAGQDGLDQVPAGTSLIATFSEEIALTGGSIFAFTGLERLDIFKNDLVDRSNSYFATPIIIGFQQPVFTRLILAKAAKQKTPARRCVADAE